VTEALARIAQAGLDVFGFKVWKFFPKLNRRKPSRQQLQDVNYADPHPAHAGLSAALLGVDGYSLSEFRHIDKDITTGICGLTFWLRLVGARQAALVAVELGGRGDGERFGAGVQRA
jgi:hypothetical protein